MLDAAGGLEYLVEGVIENAHEYLTQEVVDFAEVGVKAIDNYTLQYKVVGDPSYFLTYLSYNIYQPLNKEYFLSKGGALGKAEYAEAVASDSYVYGTTRENILTCGAYYISEYADQSNIVFLPNSNYWDAGNIQISEIKWYYNDGSNQLAAYDMAKKNTISGAGLNTAAIEQCKTDNLFDTYSYSVDTTSTTYFAAVNLHRQTYVLGNGGVASSQTAEEQARTQAAVLNQNFRLALAHAFNKANWNAQSVGEELKNNALRNSYTPYGFVSLTEEVTAQVGNETKTYAAGTQYGVILQDYCDALGLAINVQDGCDGWYNVEEAQERIAAAVAELAEEGVVIDSTHKVVIDIFYYSASASQTNQANSYKRSVEAAIGDFVEVRLVEANTTDDYYASGYRAANGAASNYDVFYGSGWGPDYGDPSTYLDTFLAEGNGYMTKTIGLW
jgi:ABC-type oligopeptide transport system substrate-binding subunit